MPHRRLLGASTINIPSLGRVVSVCLEHSRQSTIGRVCHLSEGQVGEHELRPLSTYHGVGLAVGNHMLVGSKCSKQLMNIVGRRHL